MNSKHIYNIKNHSEINYLIDCENFISENKHIDFNKYNKNSIIFFSYTSNFHFLINYLEINNIKFDLLSDELQTEFIIINK